MIDIGDKIQIDENTVFEVRHFDTTFKGPTLCDGVFWYLNQDHGIKAYNIPAYVLDNMVNQKIWRKVK